MSLLPPFVELSSEIRQYALLLCFLIAGAYLLELALDENSVGHMSAFFVFLYLAMLTHFSAILFAGAVGIYSLWRLCSSEPSRMLLATWAGGQAGAFGLFVFLFRTHIASLKNSPDAQHMQVALANSYFHPGHGHLLPFVFARTFGVFQYTFGQLAVGDIAGVLFVFAIALLLGGNQIPVQSIQDQRNSRPPRSISSRVGSVSRAAIRGHMRGRDCRPVSLWRNPAFGFPYSLRSRWRQLHDSEAFPPTTELCLRQRNSDHRRLSGSRLAASPLHAP